MAITEVMYETLFRYFHILAGITWIGLLYFFNLVNLPLLKFDMKKPVDVSMAEKASPHITLKTLWWFRWGAMFTLIFGLLLIWVKTAQIAAAGGSHADYFFANGAQGYLILAGVVLGIIMWFNVWFLIWPNQQIVLTNNLKIAAGVDPEEKARMGEENAPAAKTAVAASRFNTWASVPMLFGMVFGAHGAENFTVPFAVLAGVLVLMVLYANAKPEW